MFILNTDVKNMRNLDEINNLEYEDYVPDLRTIAGENISIPDIIDDNGKMFGTAIVLDLDQTIESCLVGDDIYREIKSNPDYLHIKNSVYRIYIDDSYNTIVCRPHLETFLDFCLRTFEFICVYSAGTKKYVDEVVDLIFQIRPDIVLCWDDVVKGPNKSYHKSLDVVKDRIKSEYGVSLNVDDIIIIDDRLNNVRSYPNNAIIIKAFDPIDLNTVINILNEDNHLIDVISHLKLLIIIRLVRSISIANNKDVDDVYFQFMQAVNMLR